MARNERPPAEQPAKNSTADDDSVEEILQQARSSVDELARTTAAALGEEGGKPSFRPGADIEMLSDVTLHVTIELGRTQMLVEDVLRMGPGSVVELDKLAGDPVDVFVNGRLVARGEVLVLNDNFCIRISEIVADLEGPDLESLGAQAKAG